MIDRVGDLVMAMADVATQVRTAYARVERAWRTSKWSPSVVQLWAIRRYKEDGHGDINVLLRRVAPHSSSPSSSSMPQMPLYSLLRWQRGPPVKGERRGGDDEYDDAEVLYCKAAPRRIRDLRRMALLAERNIVLATRSLLSAFDAAPRLPRGTVLFRGVKSVDGLKIDRRGKKFTASGLWSSSVDPRVSRSFASATDGQDQDEGDDRKKKRKTPSTLLLIVLRIAADADVPFILVTDAVRGTDDPGSFGEREVLLPHGLEVRVLRTSRMPDIDSSHDRRVRGGDRGGPRPVAVVGDAR